MFVAARRALGEHYALPLPFGTSAQTREQLKSICHSSNQRGQRCLVVRAEIGREVGAWVCAGMVLYQRSRSDEPGNCAIRKIQKFIYGDGVQNTLLRTH